MDLGLRDTCWVVTGGSSGLGLAAAEALVADGARVVLSGRNASRAAEAAAGLGPLAVGVAADLASPATPGLLLERAREHGGRVDGAVISVGGPPAGTLRESTEEQWVEAFGSVFLGPLRMARAVLDSAERPVSVTFVLSASVRQPLPDLAISNGLRPGLAGAAKTLADEYGPAGHRVNALLPRHVETERARSLDDIADDPAARRRENESRIPLRRYGRPAEFGAVAAFLASPAASYLTGIAVPVDGGALRGL